jgi:hypothetical protein
MLVRDGGGSATHFQLAEQLMGSGGDRLDGTIERFDVRFRRRSHSGGRRVLMLRHMPTP